MFSILIILLIIVQTSASLILYYSVRKFFKKRSEYIINLDFSIVIAARNEAKNIPRLINSLKNLNYPKEKYEVIIVDDNSADNTFELIKELISDLKNFSVFKVWDNKKYPGKKGALDAAINRAKNPFILITDADCAPKEDWLGYYSAKFSEGYDFIFGPAPFYQTKTLINKIACFENLRASFLVFGAAELKLPYSAMARNFGFKKSSFEQIGGYGNTIETLGGDDDLLIREAVKNKLKIGTLNNPGALVFSSTKEDLETYLKQKARHTKTAVNYLPSRKFILSTWHLLNIFALLFPLTFFEVELMPLVFIKLLFDLNIIKIYQKNFGYNFRILEMIYLQFYYEIFLIINFVNSLVKEDKW